MYSHYFGWAKYSSSDDVLIYKQRRVPLAPSFDLLGSTVTESSIEVVVQELMGFDRGRVDFELNEELD